jgi:hypothetical protein
MKIDAHQLFWQFDPVRDSWITEGGKIWDLNAQKFYKTMG